MSRQNEPMGWRTEMIITIVIMFMTATWIVFFGKEARSADYRGWFHLEEAAPKIVKGEGMVIRRLIDGPVQCYIVITEARMIGFQSSISCVAADKEKKDVTPQPETGR